MLFAVVLLQLVCSSSVLGVPQQLQQTHSMLLQQQQSSSSSLRPLCSSTSELSSAAAARIASSISGDARIHVTAVKLTGSCSALRLVEAASSSSSRENSDTKQHRAALLLSSSFAATNSSSGLTAGAGTEASLSSNIDAAQWHANSAGEVPGALVQDALQLHIDFTVASNASFFSDVVMQYRISSTDTALGTIAAVLHSTAQLSVCIEPAGKYSTIGGTRTIVLPSTKTARQQPLELLQGQQQQQEQRDGDASRTSSRQLLASMTDGDGLSTLRDLVPGLSQVRSCHCGVSCC